MRIVARPDNTVDSIDRALWLTPPFDIGRKASNRLLRLAHSESRTGLSSRPAAPTGLWHAADRPTALTVDADGGG